MSKYQRSSGATRGRALGAMDRRFAKPEAAQQDGLNRHQEWLLTQDKARQRREEAMALAAVQKSRPLKPPRPQP